MSNFLDSKAKVINASSETIHQDQIQHLHACLLLSRQTQSESAEFFLQRRLSTKNNSRDIGVLVQADIAQKKI